MINIKFFKELFLSSILLLFITNNSLCLAGDHIGNKTVIPINEQLTSPKLETKIQESFDVLSSKAKKGDKQSQIDMMVYHQTIGDGGEGMMPYFLLLYKDSQYRDLALFMTVNYFNEFRKLYDSIDKSIENYIKFVQSEYSKNSDPELIQYLACLKCLDYDPEEALNIISRLNNFKNNPATLSIYGQCMLGYKDNKFKENGILYLNKAANQGDPSAQTALGLNLYTNNNKKDGIKYLREAAKNNDARTNLLLALIFFLDNKFKNESEAKYYAKLYVMAAHPDTKETSDVVDLKVLDTKDANQKFLKINFQNGESILTSFSSNFLEVAAEP